MSKDPTPRADALRAQREERYGHLQATADTPAAAIVKEHIERTKADRLEALRKAAEAKLRPFAGKKSRGEAAKTTPEQKAAMKAKKARQRAKQKEKS